MGISRGEPEMGMPETREREFSHFPAQYQLSCSGQESEKAQGNTVPKKFISLGL